MNTRIHLRILLMGLALFILLGADTGDTGDDESSSSGCGGEPTPLLNDPSFDLWCGDELCSWQVDEGSIQQVPTWHSGDHGVGMMSDPTLISQFSQGSDDDTDCIWFTLMVDSEPGIDVQLEMDFQDDGLLEYAHTIPSTDWTTFSYYIRPPEHFDSIRFQIRKTGTGQATLAQIAADRADEDLCESRQPLVYEDLPLGATCWEGDECASGTCQATPLLSSSFDSDTTRSSCGECSAGSCGEGQVCGLAFTEQGAPYSACMQPDTKLLGEACMAGNECASDVCCEGRCSECCTDGQCDDGESCERRWSEGDAHTRMMPWMCDPDERDRAGGEACMGASDCASTLCDGQSQLRLCDAGGNPCETDADCPGYDGDEGRCVTLGPYGGMCLLDEPPGMPASSAAAAQVPQTAGK
jgi:hypothetical protein